MYDSFADLLARMRCWQEPAGLTPGRADEVRLGLRERTPRRQSLLGPCVAESIREGMGVNLQLKPVTAET
jgi:hypothetical protein